MKDFYKKNKVEHSLTILKFAFLDATHLCTIFMQVFVGVEGLHHL